MGLSTYIKESKRYVAISRIGRRWRVQSSACLSARPQPQPERVRHVLYGSLRGLDRAIKILHRLGHADPNDWCEPTPVPTPGVNSEGRRPAEGPNQWMVVMDKILLLE